MPTYKSIALAPGETYILPAGATVLSVSNTVIYSSENNCAPLTDLEPLGCYMAAIGAYSQDGDSGSTYGETVDGDTRPLVAKGIYQNGIYTPFTTGDITGLTSPVGCFDANNVGNKIKELIPGIISIAGTAIEGATPAAGNCLTFIQIQTIAAVAENLYIWMAHSVALDGGNPGGTDFLIPFKTYAYWDAIPGLTGIPGPCSVTP